MAGSIVGVFGKQRSGKTLIAYKLAKSLQEQSRKQGYKLRVYTNLWCPKDEDFVFVNSMDQLPLDLEPKIVLIDEIYNGCDAQDFRKLKDISIFINTIGKQNCLFIFTSIEANMVYNRIRNQQNMAILVKSNSELIRYKVIFMDSLTELDFTVQKTPELFKNVNYDTKYIPFDFNWSMDSWRDKLVAFYKQSYGLDLVLKEEKGNRKRGKEEL